MALPEHKQKIILSYFLKQKNALDLHPQQENQANDAQQRKGCVSGTEKSYKRPTANASQRGISNFKGQV